MPRTAMAVTLPRNPAGYCGGVGSWFPTGLWHPMMSKRMRPLSRRTRSCCKEPKWRAAKRHLATRKRLINHGYPWVSNESNGWFLWFMIIFHHFVPCWNNHVAVETMSPRPQETGRKLRDERRGEESGCRGATSNDSHEAEVQGWEWYILPDRIARYCQILPDIASSSLPGTELPDIARLGRMTKTKMV